MGDYPDYTSLMQIIGTDITLPIDIKAVTVAHIDVDLVAQTIGNIAVNIAASAVTLQVNIASQTANLNVNIAASAITLNVAIASSAVTLNVDVKAQTLTDFKITVNAQNVGVYLQPDWAAKTGIDKDFSAFASNQGWGGLAEINYNVPAGKTLFVTDVSCYLVAHLAADYNTQKHLRAYVRNFTTGAYVVVLGGNGGAAIALSKPKVFLAGQRLYAIIMNHSNVGCELGITVGGYEI